MAIGAPITNPADGINVIEVDPVPRIEGHLGIKVEVSGGLVTEADAHGNLFRGFENFLVGREANDAITFTQRICGVCPVPHGLTATYAADAVLGYSQGHITFAESADGYGVPAKAVHIRNIVLGSEFLMSSITHFYHLAAPSYVQGPAIPPWTPYFHADDYIAPLRSNGRAVPATTPDASGGFSSDLWSTVIRSYVLALRIRRLTFEAGALFAGRMPMTSCYVGGGVTNNYTDTELENRCDKYRSIMEEVGRFIVQEYVPIALALGALYPAWDNSFNHPVTGKNYGAGVGNFLSWGVFPDTTAAGTLALPGGVWTGGNGGGRLFGKVENKADVIAKFLSGTHSVPDKLREDIKNSRYADTLGEYTSNQAYPGAVSRTEPNRASGYTYLKAPRWDGNPCEVGPLARLVVAGAYPLNGGFLRDTVPGYTAYVKTVNAVTGLDPKMIAADVAVALVRSGAATLGMWDGSGWTHVDDGTNYININSLSKATVVDAYTGVSAFGDPVISDGPAISLTSWVYNLKGGLSTMDRLRARALESLVLVQALLGAVSKAGATLAFGTDNTSGWIGGLRGATGPTWRDLPIPAGTRQGWGAVEAPRGALMHQVTIDNGKITKYQCIVPTTWNASPKDFANKRGPMEQAMIGVPYAARVGTFTKQDGSPGDGHGGVEVLRVAQSFDPCIACAVH